MQTTINSHNQCFVACQPPQQNVINSLSANELHGANQVQSGMTTAINPQHHHQQQSRAQLRHDQALCLHHQRERLNHLIGLIGSQNRKLQCLKLLRGLVQQHTSVNEQLALDLQHLRDEITVKELKLQEAKSKLDTLEQRLSYKSNSHERKSTLLNKNSNEYTPNGNLNNNSGALDSHGSPLPTSNGCEPSNIVPKDNRSSDTSASKSSSFDSEDDTDDDLLVHQTSLIELDNLDLNEENSHGSSAVYLDDDDRFQSQSSQKPLLPFITSNNRQVDDKPRAKTITQIHTHPSRDLNQLKEYDNAKHHVNDEKNRDNKRDSIDDVVSTGQISSENNYATDSDGQGALKNNDIEDTQSLDQAPGIVRRVSFDPLALLLDAALEGELELVKRTSREVADISASNDEGLTALHNAVVAGHFDIVKYLVEQGCDVNGQDGDGWTPLHCAASCNNLMLIQFLVEHGASIFATTLFDGHTAANKCKEEDNGYGECYKYLSYIEDHLGQINGGRVYALFDYEAQRSDELSFKEDDELIVLRKDDDQEQEWWWARNLSHESRPEGFIPRNLLGAYPRVKRKNFN